MRHTKTELDEMEAAGELFVCPQCDYHGHVDEFGKTCPSCDVSLVEEEEEPKSTHYIGGVALRLTESEWKHFWETCR